MIIARIICFVNTYFYIFEHKFSTKIKFGTKQRINELLSLQHSLLTKKFFCDIM